MSSYELLPCPFCGGESNGQTTVNVTETARSGPRFGVHCYFCGARVEFFETVDEAIEAWNTRAEMPRWTCELEEIESYSNALEVIHVMECSECGETCEHTNGSYPRCPNCGRKAVKR